MPKPDLDHASTRLQFYVASPRCGAEVVHLGHNRSVDEVVTAALQEDAQGIAILISASLKINSSSFTFVVG